MNKKNCSSSAWKEAAEKGEVPKLMSGIKKINLHSGIVRHSDQM